VAEKERGTVSVEMLEFFFCSENMCPTPPHTFTSLLVYSNISTNNTTHIHSLTLFEEERNKGNENEK